MIEDGGCVESLHTTAGLRLKAKMLWHLLYRFFFSDRLIKPVVSYALLFQPPRRTPPAM